MNFFSTFLVATIVGRCALFLTPPGRPGGHSLRELPLTLAVSWFIGSLLLNLHVLGCYFVLGREFDPRLTLVPWVVAALVKWRLGPGAMVPRHEPLRQRLGAWDWALTLLAVSFAGYSFWKAWSSEDQRELFVLPLAAFTAVCLVPVYAEGLRTLGRPKWTALVAGLLILLRASADAPFVEFRPGVGGAAALMGGGAAFALVSWRRADRRAMTLAVACFAGLPLMRLVGNHDAPLTVGVPMILGLGVLIAFQPPQSQMRLLRMCIAGAILGSLAFLMIRSDGTAPPATQSFNVEILPFLALLLVATWRYKTSRRSEPEFIGLLLLTSFLLAYGLSSGSYREFCGIAPLCIAAGLSRKPE